MCKQVTCKQCGLATWSGCGAHVEQVLGHLPAAKRCQGHSKEKAIAAGEGKRRWFRR